MKSLLFFFVNSQMDVFTLQRNLDLIFSLCFVFFLVIMLALCWSLVMHYYNGRWQFDCLQLEKQVIWYSPSCQVTVPHSTKSSWQCGLAPIFKCFDACVTSPESEIFCLLEMFLSLLCRVFSESTIVNWAAEPLFCVTWRY